MRNTDTSSSDTYPLKLYIHDYTAPTYETTSYTKTLKLDQNNELVIPYSNLDISEPIELNLVNIPECSTLISLYNSSDIATVTVSTADGSNLKFYYDDEAVSSSVTLDKGVNVIETSAGIKISVDLSPESGQDISGQLTISSIKEASGLNSRFFENNLFEKAE
jgi:multidrug efflux pump subunit AcrB